MSGKTPDLTPLISPEKRAECPPQSAPDRNPLSGEGVSLTPSSGVLTLRGVTHAVGVRGLKTGDGSPPHGPGSPSVPSSSFHPGAAQGGPGPGRSRGLGYRRGCPKPALLGGWAGRPGAPHLEPPPGAPRRPRGRAEAAGTPWPGPSAVRRFRAPRRAGVGLPRVARPQGLSAGAGPRSRARPFRHAPNQYHAHHLATPSDHAPDPRGPWETRSSLRGAPWSSRWLRPQPVSPGDPRAGGGWAPGAGQEAGGAHRQPPCEASPRLLESPSALSTRSCPPPCSPAAPSPFRAACFPTAPLRRRDPRVPSRAHAGMSIPHFHPP